MPCDRSSKPRAGEAALCRGNAATPLLELQIVREDKGANATDARRHPTTSAAPLLEAIAIAPLPRVIDTIVRVAILRPRPGTKPLTEGRSGNADAKGPAKARTVVGALEKASKELGALRPPS